ncbi:MAG: hypothetical protein ACFE8L_03595 [Candidatus Hodarchaeota archaeon]
MEEKLISVLLYGEGKTEELTNQIAECYKNCPYITFMATKGRELYSIYFLPEKQKWWIETIEKNPQGTLGLKKVQLTFFEKLQFPKRMKLHLPKKLVELSPCGANCGTCPSSEKCTCCPATVYYKL